MKALAAVLAILFSAMSAQAAPNTQEECEAAGGTWGKYGMARVEMCDMPTADKDKVCTENADCESNLCLDDGNTEHGKCFGSTVKAGCFDVFNAKEAARGVKARVCMD